MLQENIFHEIIYMTGALVCLSAFLYLLRRHPFVNLILERIIPSIISERLQEAKELQHLFDEADNILNSQNRFIRTSTFEKICEKLNSFKIKSFFNKKTLSRQLKQLQASRKYKNQIFKQKDIEFASHLFKDDSGISTLNDEQLTAVIADEDYNLIIAGAGSGKTTVIAHKVKYLVEKGADPQDILLLSFTKASAASLQDRIQKTMGISIAATTLHSFAYSTKKKENEGRLLIAEEKQLYAKVYEALLAVLSKKNYLQFFLDFYQKYFYDIKPLVYYKNIQDLRSDLKKAGVQLTENNDSFEEINLRERLSTLNGELVRSIDERYIADFLFIHGIKYVYEKKYELVPYDYYPDFYLCDYDIYLEHFAIDKTGKAPPLFDNPKKYVTDAQAKRDLHKKMGTYLIETHSGYLNDENSDDYISKILNKAGIETKSINTSVVEHISRKFNQFVYTFYTRLKLSGKTLEELKNNYLMTPYKVFFSFYEGFASEFEELKKRNPFFY